MHRRAFVGGTLCFLAAPAAAAGQQTGKVPRVGYLSAGSDSTRDAAFRQGLRELRYVEGNNITVEYRFADGAYERLPDFAAELVRLNVNLIVTSGSAANRAAERVTQTIPIVMALNDLPGTGSSTSFRRPGTNITGLTNMNAELSGKRLGLLKETVPRLSRVALLWNPRNPVAHVRTETEKAATTLGLDVQVLEVSGPGDFEKAFEKAALVRAGAVIDSPDTLFFVHRKRLAELAAQHRLPTMYFSREHPEAGSLMSYGANIPDLHRRAAIYVDKILKGATPADLPIEQATKFDFVVNLKTAKTLGLTIPQSLLLRADQIIQ